MKRARKIKNARQKWLQAGDVMAVLLAESTLSDSFPLEVNIYPDKSTSAMIPPEDGIERAKKQQEDYTNTIYHSTRHGVDIGKLRDTAQGLQPMPKYATYFSLRFVYELLNMEERSGVTQQVKLAVDAWLQVCKPHQQGFAHADTREG